MFYIILGAILFFLLVNFTNKLSALDSRILKLEKVLNLKNEKVLAKPETIVLSQPVQTVLSGDVAINTMPVTAATSIVANAGNGSIPEADFSENFAKWLSEDWLLKIGGLFLLIGLGWFTSYAFMHNWIGEIGRIMLGLLAGVAILTLGSWRIKKYVNQGGIFLVVGSTTILLTVFAAREMYNMFTPSIALIIMFMSASFIAFMSVRYNAIAVAFSGLILSVVAPFLTNSEANDKALFAYLLVVVLGVIWIVAVKKKWGSLVFASLVAVGLYSLPFISNPTLYKSENYLLIFAYIFAAVFFISSIVSILKSEAEDINSFLFVAVGNGLFILFWILSFVPKEWQSLSICMWAIFFSVGAFLLFKATKIKECFYVYAGVSVVFIATATAIELSGNTLTVAYIMEGTLIPSLVYLITKDYETSFKTSLVMLVPFCMTTVNIFNYSVSKDVFSKDFFVLCLMMFALLLLGLMYRRYKTRIDLEQTTNEGNIFIIASSIYAYALLWMFLHIGIENYSQATIVALILFTIIGFVKYFYGIFSGSEVLKNYGRVVLILVVLRLIFVDVWLMEIGSRIVVFVLIGILFMSTAFISKKIVPKLINQPNQ